MQPTPYEDVNAILHVLFHGVEKILGKRLIGMYLYGSLSLGDFDSRASDVDFLVVTATEVTQEEFEQLQTLHKNIATSGLPYATHLEGSYIPEAAIRCYDPQNVRHPTIGVDWPFQIAPHGKNWILERHIIREHGIVVTGPRPETLIDPVSASEIKRTVCEQLNTFWRAQLNSPEWLRPREYQAFAILTLCRALYSLHYGTLSSKPQAAHWACKHYPHWKPVIERALQWRYEHEEAEMSDMLTFLREVLDHAEQLCLKIS